MHVKLVRLKGHLAIIMWRIIDLASENEVKTQKDSVLLSAYQHGDASLLCGGGGSLLCIPWHTE